MMTGIMTQDRYARFFNKYHKTPECVSCKAKIHINESIEVLQGARKAKYACSTCKEKPVLVYQYPSSLPANKVGEKLYAKT
jgi:predicted RNA-binding Zn-ribbon protein involved in translation (DUF1610 family)